MESHQRLDRTMFWTGAMIALTPLILALAVVVFVLYDRRRRRAGGKDGG
jgi:hypothetical protein